MKTLLVLFCLLSLSVSVVAQQGVELSHYIFPEFRQATVALKNGKNLSASLNYNAASEEMVFDENGKKLAIANVMLPQIDTIFIGKRKFLYVDGRFMELLHKNGYTLLAQYKCKIQPPAKPAPYGGTSETSSTTSYSSWMSGGQVYELKLPDDFKIQPYTVYRIERGTESWNIATMKQLKNHYKEKRENFDRYTKNNKINFNDPGDVNLLIRHMTEN